MMDALSSCLPASSAFWPNPTGETPQIWGFISNGMAIPHHPHFFGAMGSGSRIRQHAVPKLQSCTTAFFI